MENVENEGTGRKSSVKYTKTETAEMPISEDIFSVSSSSFCFLFGFLIAARGLCTMGCGFERWCFVFSDDWDFFLIWEGVSTDFGFFISNRSISI